MAQVEDTEKWHISRDLLQRFISVNHLAFPVKLEQPSDDADAEQEELELTLGLSLNGRFGVDPSAKKIKRTSSIPEFVNPGRDDQDMASYVMPMAYTPLIRTCSLPTETEEEWRKRKEMQTLRRMEARKKRSEKRQRNLKAMRERNRALFESEEIGYEGSNLAEHGAAALNEFTSFGRTTSLTTRGCGLVCHLHRCHRVRLVLRGEPSLGSQNLSVNQLEKLIKHHYKLEYAVLFEIFS